MLKQYGKLDWIPALAADTKNAMMENEVFEKLAANPQLGQMPPQNAQAMAMLLQTNPGQVAQELAQFGIQLPRVRATVDDHAVHSREHGEWLKSEHAQMLPMVVQLLAEAHKAQHDQLALAAAQQSMAMGGAPVADRRIPVESWWGWADERRLVTATNGRRHERNAAFGGQWWWISLDATTNSGVGRI